LQTIQVSVFADRDFADKVYLRVFNRFFQSVGVTQISASRVLAGAETDVVFAALAAYSAFRNIIMPT
jgi:hypothetical protein